MHEQVPESDRERVKSLEAENKYLRNQLSKFSVPFEPGVWTKIYNRNQLYDFYVKRLPSIKEAAKSLGYAIAVHGSMRRDLDVVAIPWTNEAADKDTLASTLLTAASGFKQDTFSWETKPLGREATSMPICWYEGASDVYGLGHLDLSVTPRSQSMSSEHSALQVLREMRAYIVCYPNLTASAIVDKFGELLMEKKINLEG